MFGSVFPCSRCARACHSNAQIETVISPTPPQANIDPTPDIADT
jgi:hypothetical protein